MASHSSAPDPGATDAPKLETFNYDAFLVKLSPAGAHVWSKRFGNDNYNQLIEGVGAAPDGSASPETSWAA